MDSHLRSRLRAYAELLETETVSAIETASSEVRTTDMHPFAHHSRRRTPALVGVAAALVGLGGLALLSQRSTEPIPSSTETVSTTGTSDCPKWNEVAAKSPLGTVGALALPTNDSMLVLGGQTVADENETNATPPALATPAALIAPAAGSWRDIAPAPVTGRPGAVGWAGDGIAVVGEGARIAVYTFAPDSWRIVQSPEPGASIFALVPTSETGVTAMFISYGDTSNVLRLHTLDLNTFKWTRLNENALTLHDAPKVAVHGGTAVVWTEQLSEVWIFSRGSWATVPRIDFGDESTVLSAVLVVDDGGVRAAVSVKDGEGDALLLGTLQNNEWQTLQEMSGRWLPPTTTLLSISAGKALAMAAGGSALTLLDFDHGTLGTCSLPGEAASYAAVASYKDLMFVGASDVDREANGVFGWFATAKS